MCDWSSDGCSSNSVTAWERISRDAAVVAGRADWDTRLTQLALQSEERADEAEADDEQPEWLPARERSAAERARALRSFVLRVIDDLAEVGTRPRDWTSKRLNSSP